MNPSTRPTSDARRPRITPVSAATLLLLVTMVLSTTPMAPASSPARVADDRSAPIGTTVQEVGVAERASRRRHHGQSQHPRTVITSRIDKSRHQRSLDVPKPDARAQLPAAARTHVRLALLDLPPPAASLV